MTYTKQVTIDADWLNSIGGMSVKAAIEFLSTLNPEHVLSYGKHGKSCLRRDAQKEIDNIVTQARARYK